MTAGGSGSLPPLPVVHIRIRQPPQPRRQDVTMTMTMRTNRCTHHHCLRPTTQGRASSPPFLPPQYGHVHKPCRCSVSDTPAHKATAQPCKQWMVAQCELASCPWARNCNLATMATAALVLVRRNHVCKAIATSRPASVVLQQYVTTQPRMSNTPDTSERSRRRPSDTSAVLALNTAASPWA